MRVFNWTMRVLAASACWNMVIEGIKNAGVLWALFAALWVVVAIHAVKERR